MDEEDRLLFSIRKVVKNHDKYPFPVFLKKIRETRGVERKRVAKECGLKEDRLKKLETGFKRRIYRDELFKLSKVLGVDINLLLEKSFLYVYEQSLKVAVIFTAFMPDLLEKMEIGVF